MIDEITIIGVSSILTLNMRVNKIHNPAILINTINCIMIFIPRVTIQNPAQVGSQSECVSGVIAPESLFEAVEQVLPLFFER